MATTDHKIFAIVMAAVAVVSITLLLVLSFGTIRPLYTSQKVTTASVAENYSGLKEEYVPISILDVNGTTIIVGSGCKAIIADTSEERAQSIAFGLIGEMDERPNVHDGMTSLLQVYNITLNYVVMYRYDNTTGAYYSDAVFQKGSDVLVLDMRPSDAFALALRTKSQIYINKTMLDEVGVNIC